MISFCILFLKPFGNLVTAKELLQPTPQLAVLSNALNYLSRLLVHTNVRWLKKSSIEKHCVIVYFLTCQQVGCSMKVPGENIIFKNVSSHNIF